MAAAEPRPSWAEKVRHAYLSGETSMFLLHMNVHDHVPHGNGFMQLTEYVARVLLWDNKRNILVYEPSAGITVLRGEPEVTRIEELRTKRAPRDVLPLLEAILLSRDSTAIILPYAGALVPAGEMSFLSEQDRANIVTLHRWSFTPALAKKDSVVFLQSEALTEVHPMLVGNPRIATVGVPLPDRPTRAQVIRQSDPRLSSEQVERLADETAGLRSLQISSLLRPSTESDLEESERRTFIANLLGTGPDIADRAQKLAALTRGMGPEEIRHLINPTVSPASTEDAFGELLTLLHQRKREIIEKECAGLIEFIDSKHGLDAVGGLDGVKEELRQVAASVRSGDRASIPMGLLFVGPMGCGKTFVANAFIKESGLSAVRLQNFRSKWVGSTESNLEKVLNMVRSLGPIILVIDEGDRALGATGDSDGGTSSRVIARLKEFMSDPENRGRVIVILMTNRPDKLDVDIKRAGRLDRKIPFFYPDRPEQVEAVLDALLRRYGVPTELDWENDRSQTSAKLVGYSNADLEAVVLLARDRAIRAGAAVDAWVMAEAVSDYVPSRDADMLEYMELLAVFEASRRSLLPERLRNLSSEELNLKLKEKRIQIRM